MSRNAIEGSRTKFSVDETRDSKITLAIGTGGVASGLGLGKASTIWKEEDGGFLETRSAPATQEIVHGVAIRSENFPPQLDPSDGALLSMRILSSFGKPKRVVPFINRCLSDPYDGIRLLAVVDDLCNERFQAEFALKSID